MNEPTNREQNELVRERFTRSAEAFSRQAVSRSGSEADVITRLADPRPEDVGLDLACGPGTFTLALAGRARHVFGVDLTPALLERARYNLEGVNALNVTLICGDATALPFPDESIDVAVCGYSFHHMSGPLLALGEMARVVRAGGRLALVDMVVLREEDSAAVDEIERARDASHRHTFLRTEFSEAVENAGFHVHEVETLERVRLFSEWMRGASWLPADPAWRNTQRLMEEGLPAGAAGFRGRRIPGENGADPEIEFVQTCLFLAAAKI